MVLGRMTARIDTLPVIGEEHVVVGASARQRGSQDASPRPRSTTRTAGWWRAPSTSGSRSTRPSSAGCHPGRTEVLTPRPLLRRMDLMADFNDPKTTSAGGATPSSTRSTSAASPTPTVTASATWPASPRGCPTSRDLGRRRALDHAVLHLPAARPRLRRRRLPRRRPAVRQPRRRRRADRPRARARPAGDRRPRPQPHLRRARVVPGGAGRRARQPRARPLPVPRRPGPAARRRPTTGPPSSAAPPGPASADADQWYLHLFDTTQPDLDWRNPEVRRHVRGRAALLARPRRRRLPRRRRARPLQGGSRCATRSCARARAPPPARSTPTTRWSSATSRTSRCGTSPRCTTSTAAGTAGPRRVRPRPDGRRRGLDPDAGVDGRVRAPRRARPGLQLRLAAGRLVGRRRSPRSSPAPSPPSSRSAPPRPGCSVNHDVVRHVTRYGGGDTGWPGPARPR